MERIVYRNPLVEDAEKIVDFYNMENITTFISWG